MHFRKSLPCYGDLQCVGYIWWKLFGFVYIGSSGLCSFLNFIFCEGPIWMSAMSMSYSLRVFLSRYVALFLLKLFVYMFLGTLVLTPCMVLHIYGWLVIVVMLSLIDFVKYFSWFSFSLCHKNILWKMQVSKTIPKTWLFNLLRFDFDLLLLCFS